MNPTTISQLLALNRQFYQHFALSFSSTRQRLQPGVLRILEGIKASDIILDLGCGNGQLARELSRRGHTGSFTGLDFSPALLEQAMSDQPASFHFQQADLSRPDWDASFAARHFDCILAFAVLHHLPGTGLRQQVLHKVRDLLKPGGRFIHSEWQFLNSPRLAERVQRWETIGLTDEDVDPGDYLLDWRQGGKGLRYVHHFSEQELIELARLSGFAVIETFLSDGVNHRLGLYQVWRQSLQR